MQLQNDMSVAPGGSTGGVQQMDDALELLLQRLWQRAKELKYVLLFVSAATILLGVAFTLLQTPEYNATARIEISRIDSGAAAGEDLRFDMQMRDRQYYETQYELLGSRFLAERVVEAENFGQDLIFRDALGIEESNLSPHSLDMGSASRVRLTLECPDSEERWSDMLGPSPTMMRVDRPLDCDYAWLGIAARAPSGSSAVSGEILDISVM